MPSLLSLPLEINLQIFGQFCLHCRGEHTKSWDTPLQPLQPPQPQHQQHHWRHQQHQQHQQHQKHQKYQQQGNDSWYSHDRQALSSLSLVCKQLRGIAQPVLYHEFVFDYGNSRFPSHYQFHGRLTSFMRTLASRPDLAELVQTVHISPNVLRAFDTEEAQTVLLESARSLGIDLREAWASRRQDRARDYMSRFDLFIEDFLSPVSLPNQSRSSLGLDPLTSPWADGSKGGRSRLASEITALLLAQLPNLQHFSIQEEDGWFYGRILAQALEALQISSLQLKRADIGIRDMSWVQLATGLEEMHVRSCIPKNALAPMPNLRTLRITKGVFSEPELKYLFSNCAGSLYTFAYEADKPWDTDMHGLPNDHFQPSDLINHLEGHRETLQLLHLDLFAQGYHIRGISPEITLQDFTALRHLFLTSTVIYDESSVDGTSEPNALFRFLPQSLISLSINGASGHVRLEEGLFELAQHKQRDPTQFPYLKRVRANFRSRFRVLSHMFEAAGVDFGLDVGPLTLD